MLKVLHQLLVVLVHQAGIALDQLLGDARRKLIDLREHDRQPRPTCKLLLLQQEGVAPLLCCCGCTSRHVHMPLPA